MESVKSAVFKAAHVFTDLGVALILCTFIIIQCLHRRGKTLLYVISKRCSHVSCLLLSQKMLTAES